MGDDVRGQGEADPIEDPDVSDAREEEVLSCGNGFGAETDSG